MCYPTHAMRGWLPPRTTHQEAVTKRHPSHLLEIVLVSSPLVSYDLKNYERQSTDRTHKACLHVAHTPSSATPALAVCT